MKRQTDYAFCVARIRANETKLLDDDFIIKLAEAKDYPEAVRMLSEKHWMSQDESINQAVRRQSFDLWQLLKESVPYKDDLELLCVTNNFQNIKVAIKCILTGENAESFFVYPTTLDLHELVNSVKVLGFERLEEKYIKCAQKAYETATATENGQLSDIIIDSAALVMLQKYAADCKEKSVSRALAFIADSSNIKIAFRCAATNKDISFIEEAISVCRYLDRQRLIDCCLTGFDAVLSYLKSTQYSEGAEIYSQTPSLYDKWCDCEIIRITNEAKYTAFGFSPVCSYYYKRLTEIKCVRMILSAKLAGADISTVKERVRALNV